MIQWKSVKPDAAPRDLVTVLSGLALADTLALTQCLLSHPLVLFAGEALEVIRAHVSQRREESGGLLLGYAAAPEASVDSPLHPLVCVTESVPSTQYEGTSVSLHMDPAVWTAALTGRRAGLLVVGWFHSHPNLGAFFSGTDRHTQRSFFSHRYSVGYVIDPVRDDHAFFIGAESMQLERAQVKLMTRMTPMLAALGLTLE